MKQLTLIIIIAISTTISSLAQNDLMSELYISKPNEGMMEMRGPNNKYGYITEKEYYKKPRYITTYVDGKMQSESIPYIFVIEPQFDEADSFYKGVAIVQIGGKCGVIDKKGKFVIEPQFDGLRHFYEGVAIAKIGDKYGMIDKKGKIVCPIIYASIDDFRKRLVAVYHQYNPYGDDNKLQLFDKKTHKLDSTIYNNVEYLSANNFRITIGDKQGVVDSMGKQLIPPIYTSIKHFDGRLYIASRSKGWGFIDTTGKLVIDHNLEKVHYSSGNSIFAKNNRLEWQVLDTKGNPINNTTYNKIGELRCGLATVQHVHVNYIDSMGNTVIANQFCQGEDFSEDLAAVNYLMEKWGYIDKSGKFVIEPQFDKALAFCEGLAAVVLNGKCAYIDTSGKVAIKPNAISIKSFNQGLAPVKINAKWGYINKKGDVVIDTLFYGAECFYNDRARVWKDKKCAYIDTTGAFITDYIFDYAFDFSTDTTTAVSYNGKWGFINKSGQFVIEPKYDDAMPYYKGVAIVKSGDYWSYIDSQQNVILKVEYDKARYFINELAPVYQKNRVTIFDTMGNVVLEPKYQEVERFDVEGLATVNLNDKWGYINRNWELVIKPKYDYASQFSDGLAAVCIDQKWGYINKKGVIVIKPKFDLVDEFSSGYAAFGLITIPENYTAESVKYGIINGVGKVIIEPQYQEIYPYDGGGLFVVQLDNKWGYVDITGKVVIEPKYEQAYPFGHSQTTIVKLNGQDYDINRNGKILGEHKYEIVICD